MAYGTISRIFSLTSDVNRGASIKRIYEILRMNSYPQKLIKQLIQKFDRQTTNNIKTSTNGDNNTISKYRGLTYTTHLSDNLRNLLVKYDSDLRIGFKPLSTINKLIPTPYTKTPTAQQHGIIYSFSCNNCDGQYIGQTGQKLINRIKQHQNDHKSKKPRANNTAAFYHSQNTGHTFDFDNTKIITTEKHLQKRLILESININLNKSTSINLKSDIDTLNPSYSNLIQNLGVNMNKYNLK